MEAHLGLAVLVTRLVPKNHSNTLSARTLTKVIELEQNLIFYAACDVVYGPNPAFADLRSLKEPLTKFATLTMEPFEPGSFVIPARLESVPFRSDDPEATPFDSLQVIERFQELLASIDDSKRAASISLGALQTCQELGRMLRREIETIEMTTFDRENAPKPTFELNLARVERVGKLLDQRNTTQHSLERLRGRLVSLNVDTNEFAMAVPAIRRPVKGNVAFFQIGSLRNYLGETITLEGVVSRSGKDTRMVAHKLVIPDDE